MGGRPIQTSKNSTLVFKMFNFLYAKNQNATRRRTP